MVGEKLYIYKKQTPQLGIMRNIFKCVQFFRSAQHTNTGNICSTGT